MRESEIERQRKQEADDRLLADHLNSINDPYSPSNQPSFSQTGDERFNNYDDVL